jgi:uncharacterized membrane protein
MSSTTAPPPRETAKPFDLHREPPGARVVWWIVAPLAIAVGGYGLTLQDARPDHARFFGLVLLDEAHFAAGGVAAITGALALHRGLLSRARSWHRRIGKLYMFAVLVSGLAGLVLATVSMGGATTHAGFALLAVLWLVTSGAGLLAIKAGDVARHRRFMIRSFALCFAAVTLRIELPLLVAAFSGDFESAYRVVSWACWLPNLAVAEWWLARMR